MLTAKALRSSWCAAREAELRYVHIKLYAPHTWLYILTMGDEGWG
jgi:hypothetical protein